MSYRKCVVFGCNNVEKKRRDKQFYRFPGRDFERERKNKWIQFIRKGLPDDKKDWLPSENSRVCTDHFVGFSKSNLENHRAYLPTIYFPSAAEVPISNKALIPKTKPAPQLVNEIKVPIITSTATLRTYGNQKLLQDTTKQTSFNCFNEIEMLDIKQEAEPEPCDTQQPSFNFCDKKEIFLEDITEKVEPLVINQEPIMNHIQCISPVQYNKLKRRLTRLNLTNRRMKQENFRLRKKPDFNETLYRNLDVKSPSVKTFVLMQIFHKKGTEWTQSEKDLALSIYMKSPTTYRFLFKSLGFVLPSPKTISKWPLPKSPLK